MEKNKIQKEIVVIILSILILATSVSFLDLTKFPIILLSFAIIIGANVLTKKVVAYHYEADTKTKLWSLYHFGFKARSHFKKPVPMIWLPLVLAPLGWNWLAVLETEIIARTERVSKRHGLYRFSEMTEWHIALITFWAIAMNLILAVVGYGLGFETFSRLSIYYAAWSIIPLSNLDGSKILFGNRVLWVTSAIIILGALIWGVMIL